MKKNIFALLAAAVLLASCTKNNDWEFPDFDYSTVYFPYQSPVRTITLGEDIYDNTLDNQHKSLIMATLGGVYSNKKDVAIDVVVDNTLTQNLKYSLPTGVAGNVVAMPANYYSLPANMKIVIPEGKMSGGIEVTLTDAFFADPLAVTNNYVIPLRMTKVSGADSILRGKTSLSNPDRRIAQNWSIVPKDYILYAVKFINQYHGNYLRRGVDDVKGNGGNTALDTKISYHKQYVEQDEVVSLTTNSLTDNTLSLFARNKDNSTTAFAVRMKFDNAGKCVVSAPAAAGYTVSGTGEFVKKGDMWGNEKRDVLRLKYQVAFAASTHNFTDTIVMRDRGVKLETFNFVVQ
ncbi:DUF5627 domain-containing protein [Mucilaginibacter calamicampi]|uniref:DUF5627 domain-containing protein n=1 Tax=Mucilaginibacter calamicampi TaxID=1302352 RepID=A0ABW2Z570_9SPHI